MKDISTDESDDLDFRSQSVDLDDVDDELWRALAGLDRQDLAARTVEAVVAAGTSLTMAELADALPPTHDLETLSVWVEMAHQAELDVDDHRHESIDVDPDDGPPLRFRVPLVRFEPDVLAERVWEL